MGKIKTVEARLRPLLYGINCSLRGTLSHTLLPFEPKGSEKRYRGFAGTRKVSAQSADTDVDTQSRHLCAADFFGFAIFIFSKLQGRILFRLLRRKLFRLRSPRLRRKGTNPLRIRFAGFRPC